MMKTGLFLLRARFLPSFVKGKPLRLCSATNGQVSGALSQESLPPHGDHI